MSNQKLAVILAAAGKSTRFKDAYQKKVFVSLAGRPVWQYSAELFSKRSDVGQILLVIDSDDREYFQEKFAMAAAMLGVEVVIGGAERFDSVARGLEKVREEFLWVAVHDAARPCITNTAIEPLFAEARKTGAAILAEPIHGTVKRVSRDRVILETVPREGLWQAQTPQVFRRDWLIEAHKIRDKSSVTDDAQLLERIGKPVSIVANNSSNIKITTQDDLRLAEQILKAAPKPRGFPF